MRIAEQLPQIGPDRTSLGDWTYNLIVYIYYITFISRGVGVADMLCQLMAAEA